MTGRRSQPRSRPSAVSLAGVLLAVFMLGPAAGPAGAQSGIGQGLGAHVLCNPYDNVLTLTPGASAASGYSSQWIYAVMWLYQDGVGWRTDLQPPMASMFEHRVEVIVSDGLISYISRTQSASGDPWHSRPGEGRYAVYTDYWWWTGSGWVGPVGVWSQWMEYTYSLAPNPGVYCDLTLV